jgi:voltage-gated potassium channel
MSAGPTPITPPAPSAQGAERRRYARLFRFSVRQLLFFLVLLLILRPFFESGGPRQLIESLLFTFILLSSLLAVGAARWELAVGLLLIVPALTFRWLTHLLPLQPTDPVPLVFFSFALAFTIWQMLRFVVRAVYVDFDVLCAGISAYLLLGLLWANLYSLVDRFVPGSFLFPGLPGHPPPLSADDAIYFSLSALTTAGFGDIIPRLPIARSLSTLESVTGVLYLAVLIGRLVAMHLQNAMKAGNVQTKDS